MRNRQVMQLRDAGRINSSLRWIDPTTSSGFQGDSVYV